MKAIFDRSAFHRDTFDLLRRSRLSQLVRERKIFVFHTPVFLEETVRLCRSRKEELNRQGPFLLFICNAGWFKPLLFHSPVSKSICREELEGGQSCPLIHYFVRRRVESRLNEFFEGSVPVSELVKAEAGWHENEQRKKLQKSLLSSVRCSRTRIKGETFPEYFRSILPGYPLELIEAVISVDQPDVRPVLGAWRRKNFRSSRLSSNCWRIVATMPSKTRICLWIATGKATRSNCVFLWKWKHQDGSVIKFAPEGWYSDDPAKTDWLNRESHFSNAWPIIPAAIRLWLQQQCELVEFRGIVPD